MVELGVAVIGAGRMGGFHVDTWERLDRARLVALADPDLPEPVSAHDGARALAAALAVRQSAQEHRPIELMSIPAVPA